MSSSLLRTTPVRAITTTLATRSSPSIPLSNQTFEPIVKSILRQRFYSIFLYSALLSWVSASAWTIWGRGSFNALGMAGTFLVPVLPFTLFVTTIRWLVSALPAAVLRKVYLTPSRTPATSPSAVVKSAFAKSSTTRAGLVAVVSAIIDLAIHIAISYTNEMKTHGDPKLGLFVKSKKHPYYLNGRLLFLVFSQLTVALGFTLRSVMLERFMFRWSFVNKQRTRFNPADIVKAAVLAAVVATMTVPFASIVFGLVRLVLPVLLRLPLVPLLLRPFTGHFLRGSWTIFLPLRHLSLLYRSWFISFTTLFSWEFSNFLFDTFIYQPVNIAHATPEPHVTLVSGISSPDIAFRFFAYKELKNIGAEQSQSSATRRAALFNDQKYSPGLWSQFARESLLLLGRDYQLVLRRGKPELPRPAPAAPVVAVLTNPLINATPTPLIRASIFQSGKQVSPIRTVIDSLGSDGPLAQALDAGAEAAHIPELFKSVEATVLPAPVKEEVKKSMENATGIVERLSNQATAVLKDSFIRLVPVQIADSVADLGEWWNRERVDKAVLVSLPNGELDAVVTEALSHLVCASLVEDKYGVVQRDIPRILEAMLSFLSAIDEYRAEVQALYQPLSLEAHVNAKQIAASQTLREEVDDGAATLNVVGDALREGIARIVRTFGDKLLAFKFPPRTAQKLQPFLEYC